jgi:hypothetical protein
MPIFSIPRSSKIYPNWDFWFENIPFGNPVSSASYIHNDCLFANNHCVPFAQIVPTKKLRFSSSKKTFARPESRYFFPAQQKKVGNFRKLVFLPKKVSQKCVFLPEGQGKTLFFVWTCFK